VVRLVQDGPLYVVMTWFWNVFASWVGS